MSTAWRGPYSSRCLLSSFLFLACTLTNTLWLILAGGWARSEIPACHLQPFRRYPCVSGHMTYPAEMSLLDLSQAWKCMNGTSLFSIGVCCQRWWFFHTFSKLALIQVASQISPQILRCVRDIQTCSCDLIIIPCNSSFIWSFIPASPHTRLSCIDSSGWYKCHNFRCLSWKNWSGNLTRSCYFQRCMFLPCFLSRRKYVGDIEVQTTETNDNDILNVSREFWCESRLNSEFRSVFLISIGKPVPSYII